MHTKGRRPKKYSQADRLSRMLRALAARAFTINELAEEFAITRRQVYRDLNQIEAEGHPLVQRADLGERVWQLPLGYKGLPPITVSPHELLSLHIARAHLSYLTGTPFLEDLDAVIKKIQAGLPVKTTNHLDRIIHASFHVARPTRSYHMQRSILDVLRRALLLQRTVVLHHRVPGYRDAVAHPVDPYVLLLYQHGLYVLGQSHRAQTIRLFAVERVQDAVLTDEAFEVPPGFSMAAVDHRLFGLIDEEPRDVRIEFREDVAYLLKERQWHPTQILTPGNKGKVHV
ncbi:MAG TPA: WYL domain-containing protein, partial [Nitrospiraceae bacterium]|nr:WYL domain-containing protein [Nitrospiraceae bacterium]